MVTFRPAAALWAAACLTLATASVASQPQDPPAGKRTVWDGFYSAAQAERGFAVAKEHCARCHGQDMLGGVGVPAAAGPEMLFRWDGKPLAELFEYLRTNMPEDKKRTLTDQQYIDSLAAVLKSSALPTREADLPIDTATWKDVEITFTKPSK